MKHKQSNKQRKKCNYVSLILFFFSVVVVLLLLSLLCVFILLCWFSSLFSPAFTAHHFLSIKKKKRKEAKHERRSAQKDKNKKELYRITWRLILCIRVFTPLHPRKKKKRIWGKESSCQAMLFDVQRSHFYRSSSIRMFASRSRL